MNCSQDQCQERLNDCYETYQTAIRYQNLFLNDVTMEAKIKKKTHIANLASSMTKYVAIHLLYISVKTYSKKPKSKNMYFTLQKFVRH
jgi:hypothetical protein